MRFTTIFSIICLLALAGACTHTPPNASPPPADDDSSGDVGGFAEPSVEDVVAAMQEAANWSISGIGLTEAVITMFAESNFHACNIAEGGKWGLEVFSAATPSMAAESENPDGLLLIDFGSHDFSRCHEMPGRPEPWPPVSMDPTWTSVIEWGFAFGISRLVDLLESKLPGPEAGQSYITGRIGMGVLNQLETAIVPAVLTALTTDETEVNLGLFEADYSAYYDMTANVASDDGDQVRRMFPIGMAPQAKSLVGMAEALCSAASAEERAFCELQRAAAALH